MFSCYLKSGMYVCSSALLSRTQDPVPLWKLTQKPLHSHPFLSTRLLSLIVLQSHPDLITPPPFAMLHPSFPLPCLSHPDVFFSREGLPGTHPLVRINLFDVHSPETSSLVVVTVEQILQGEYRETILLKAESKKVVFVQCWGLIMILLWLWPSFWTP